MAEAHIRIQCGGPGARIPRAGQVRAAGRPGLVENRPNARSDDSCERTARLDDADVAVVPAEIAGAVGVAAFGVAYRRVDRVALREGVPMPVRRP